MTVIPENKGRRERGSAMVIAMLVSVILTLLGVSYLLMAETENRIAENERLSDQAMFTGEAGARMVKRWFDRPGNTVNLINPPVAVIDRSLRQIDADGDPGTAPVQADGSSTKPYYKQSIDLNGDSVDDVFDKPYRDDLYNTLLGTEAGPDMRIDEGYSSAAATFLENLSARLLSGYPATNGSHQARITRIDVYAPPYVNVAGTWTRYGMGTVKVWARIYKDLPGGEEVLSERMIKAVLNETPFPGPYGPLHSCDALAWNGDFKVHWGVGTAVSASDLHNNHKKQAASLPRISPVGEKLDTLWFYNQPGDFGSYKAAIDGLKVEDPWFRYLSGGPIADAPNGNGQPEPFGWTPGNPFADGDLPYHPSDSDMTDPYFDPDMDGVADNWDGSHANMIQNYPVSCPSFPYDTWKEIATSGGGDVHHYVWVSDTSFKENGIGTAQTFRNITDNETGLFFFDTKDGLAPYDNDGNGEYDNLTPPISLSGGTYGVRGFVYLNSENFQTTGLGGRPATFNAPEEPWQDQNLNGRYDTGEDWINLDYPAALNGDFYADASDTLQNDGTMGGAGTETWNRRGPDMAGTASVWGILYTNGFWDATGNATYYGSVISYQGIGQSNPTGGTPDLYWDQSIRDNWPPAGWDLPRVIITRWETDL